ncbi:MAG: uncharacterized protein KVP18_002007 [Porospora cf. gigantea A]|uniref:uncharacterized protein n=1 Tax=Porospora cf. gigantea A TaxID=2853593 RepID=UPI0035599D70|nr:MAG: hypothetical protein KVP18_002007 [Porospora cf. gigantea A]
MTVRSLGEVPTIGTIQPSPNVIWEAPSESSQFVYTLQPPGGYLLEMIVDLENILASAKAEGESEATLDKIRALGPIKPRYSVVEAMADGRGGVQIPYKFTLGRHYQNLEGVPTEAKRWFSRKHCSIFWQFDGLHVGEAMFSVADCSSNGTFLNGKPIQNGVEHPLADGDLIGVSTSSNGSLLLSYRFRVLSICCFPKAHPPPDWAALDEPPTATAENDYEEDTRRVPMEQKMPTFAGLPNPPRLALARQPLSPATDQSIVEPPGGLSGLLRRISHSF